MRNFTFRFFSILTLLFFIIVTALSLLEFDNSITSDDLLYAEKIRTEYTIDTIHRFDSYRNEVVFIKQIQHAVNTFALIGDGIPMHHERNIKDLYLSKKGLCYDRSHVIEKLLRVYGFETRHVSMYFYGNIIEKITAIINPHSQSHAVTEVKTSRGWMVVDSLFDIVGISETGDPLSLTQVRNLIENNQSNTPITNNVSYIKPFVFSYGIYSRNGKLYPPYNSIPDFQFCEIKYNFFD